MGDLEYKGIRDIDLQCIANLAIKCYCFVLGLVFFFVFFFIVLIQFNIYRIMKVSPTTRKNGRSA